MMTESIQKEDWERFRALGSVPPSIREIVFRSWVRSRERGEIGSLNRAPTVAQDELHGIRHRNARLRKAAQNAIRRTGYMLEDAGAMLLLCDRRGVVMDATGDSRILSRGAENHLQPGGRWDEGAIGTNAIGTALHLAQPVVITGVEHFCEAIQRWSCSAAPIHDPLSGRLLGAVDISGPAQDSMRRGAALSVTLALQIEESLRSAGLHEHAVLIDALLARHNGGGAEDLLLLDRYGRKVWSRTPSREAAAQVEAKGAVLQSLMKDNDGDCHDLAGRVREVLADAEVDVLSERGEALGVVVTFPRRTRPARREPAAPADLRQIAETGAVMHDLCNAAERTGGNGLPLVLEGPVGSGKETFARALHAGGPLAGLPFEMLDCSLLDAATLKPGSGGSEALLRLAQSGGTLCLDEPAETPAEVQPLLTQALAQIERAGTAVQLITLCSVPLSDSLGVGGLGSALHFRLAAAVLRLPALAERREDLPALIRRFAQTYAPQHRQGRVLRFTPAAMQQLQAHDWPGNLRELRNLVESLGVTSLSGLVDASDLPRHLTRAPGPRREETLRDRERAEIMAAMAEAGSNITEVARRLGIARSTLYLKLDQYGIRRPRRE